MSTFIPSKIDLTPRRHHGYAVLLFIMGTLFPPLAVAARFGINSDFWLNLLLTICGYIPGHCHNFYIQNIRNNKQHARTPKWVQRYGLVDISEIKRKERKSQWASRYHDRLPRSTYEGQPLEEGQRSSTSIAGSADGGTTTLKKHQIGDLWRPEDEVYYNPDKGTNSTRWHYPANFAHANVDASYGVKTKKNKMDRWERTEEAYKHSDGSKPRKKKRRSAHHDSLDKDPTSGQRARRVPTDTDAPSRTTNSEDVFDHQF